MTDSTVMDASEAGGPSVHEQRALLQLLMIDPSVLDDETFNEVTGGKPLTFVVQALATETVGTSMRLLELSDVVSGLGALIGALAPIVPVYDGAGLPAALRDADGEPTSEGWRDLMQRVGKYHQHRLELLEEQVAWTRTTLDRLLAIVEGLANVTPGLTPPAD